MDTYAFADKTKEKQRLEVLERRKMEREEKKESVSRGSMATSAKRKMRGVKAAETAWSVQKKKKEKKEERKEKKQRKREYLKKERMQMESKVAEGGDGREDEGEVDDWAEEKKNLKRARKANHIPADITFEGL